MRSTSLFLSLSTALVFGPLTTACGAAPGDDAESTSSDITAAGAPRYIDVEESFTSDQEFERWFALKRALRDDFDQICGDTFCEGDFTNLEALRFRCSVATGSGQLKSCLWLFAGSYETVTPSTGNVRPTARFFPCKIPVQGTPAQLVDALLVEGGERALWRPLPVSGRSIYDSLTECL